MIMRSAFDGVGQVIYPLFFATVAFFVFRAGDSPRTLLYASLGAAVMGMWSATSTTAGSAMQRERWQGTLEALVATPTNFAPDPAPGDDRDGDDRDLQPRRDAALGTASLFGIQLTLVHPLLFVLSIPATVLTLRRARLPVRGLLRPLPRRLGAREHVRVPGLADLRLPRPADLLPVLGAADLRGSSRRPGG